MSRKRKKCIGKIPAIIESEQISACDVDNTLIRPDPNGEIHLMYARKVQRFSVIQEHLDLIIEWSDRGHFIIVWSHSGPKWAAQVIKALNIEQYVDLIQAKPSRHMDDKTDVPSIVGSRVYIAKEVK